MNAPASFQEAYNTLKANAHAIEHSDVLDIDTLVETIGQSIDAYKVCMARIEEVEKALNQAFDDVSVGD